MSRSGATGPDNASAGSIGAELNGADRTGIARTAAPRTAGSRGVIRARPAGAGYAENRCALRWPLLAAGLYAPVTAVAFFIASVAVGQTALLWAALALLGAATGWWAAGSGAWLRYLWPAGIRLDAAGVRVGGVSWAERHPGRTRTRTAIVPRQCSQVFGCPWAGVLAIGVTTDRDAIRIMKRYAYRGRKLTPLGNLAVPYMRAALVIWVDEDKAALPDVRPAAGPGWYNCPADGYRQPLWVAPTRHPGRLETALAAAPLPPGTLRDPHDLVTGEGSPGSAWSAG